MHRLAIKKDAVDGFQWRDRHGNFHRPEDMSTKHLYSTLKMIWNIYAPPSLRIAPVNLYTLSSFYTSMYLATGVRAMMEELSTRHDLNIHQRIGLDLMIERVSAGDKDLISLQK